ncbi:MAG: hypothetical protein EU549_05270 [Promethearchaeota archaeon]|nr:MAG: hypothetical protein EU549_05270 [Candidatus Lokiarchaeota archaeon]
MIDGDNLIFKLKDKCLKSPKKEFFYGNIANKDIKNVYLGVGYLDEDESRWFSPGKGHEEILYLLEGKMEIEYQDKKEQLNEGEAFHASGKEKINIRNLTNERIFFVIAGGHTEIHAHSL